MLGVTSLLLVNHQWGKGTFDIDTGNLLPDELKIDDLFVNKDGKLH